MKVSYGRAKSSSVHVSVFQPNVETSLHGSLVRKCGYEARLHACAFLLITLHHNIMRLQFNSCIQVLISIFMIMSFLLKAVTS